GGLLIGGSGGITSGGLAAVMIWTNQVLISSWSTVYSMSRSVVSGEHGVPPPVWNSRRFSSATSAQLLIRALESELVKSGGPATPTLVASKTIATSRPFLWSASGTSVPAGTPGAGLPSGNGCVVSNPISGP